MKVIYYPQKILSKLIKKGVITVGVFDSLHRGHQYLIKKTTEVASLIRGESVVITFWPHPQNEPLVMSLKHRLILLERQNVDFCIIFRFNRSLANLSAEKFIELLSKKFNLKYLIVGENFRFGKGAQADIFFLKELSLKYGFKLKIIPTVKFKDSFISTTIIRRLILKGKLNELFSLLARPYSILGRVIRGRKIATDLGFPTANLSINNEIIPPYGVYIVRIRFENKIFKGLCYIGNRPTFKKTKDTKPTSIEIHIFNFKKNIYDRYLEVEFIKKLRPQKRFFSTKELIRQINKDIEKAKNFFKTSHLNKTQYI
ncbi:MAG: bifunctional riboflavin kinase/FAD synthetase [Candidatus Omnitrophica bacterium]|nr:bifunctional riboflavin kinase/FAD synthetase [Candidatus Omnitrophota bacterium]